MPGVAVITHAVLRVRVIAAHEFFDPYATRGRIDRADRAVRAMAWFERDEHGVPLVEPDGTYTVHVPGPGASLDRVRSILMEGEGLGVAYEGVAWGLGAPPGQRQLGAGHEPGECCTRGRDTNTG